MHARKRLRTILQVEQLETREVPSAVLLAGDGLRGTYYDNHNFTGASVTRLDPTVNFYWGSGAPVSGFGRDTFSARWTGQLEVPTTGTYTFYTRSDDGVRLWVKGVLLIDNWTRHPETENRASIYLTGGQRVDIRMDYFEYSGTAVAKLYWSGPGLGKQIVAQKYLYSGTLTPPAAPSNLTASVSSTTVNLAWADNSSNESGFQVERSTDGVNFSLLATVSAGVTSLQDSGLAAGTYYYRVRAVNAAGASAWSSVASATVTSPPPSPGTIVYVSNTTELLAALGQATPGTQILLRSGIYEGGIWFGDLHGTADAPIVIGAADPANRPIIRGGTTGIQLSDASYVEIRDLVIEQATGNGLNIDDAGTYDTPAHHITIRNLLVQNIGSTGNQDGIKLSGVQDFVVDGCTVQTWGAGGSGVDMVGCHRGMIQNSIFRYNDTVYANGVQAKGGSTNITIRGNFFDHAGARAVQAGGSTDLQYFRPQPPAGYEAKDILIERNVIVGSQAAIAYVGVDGAVARFNTIYCPTKWIIRILQETTEPGFVPCRNGVFTDNIVVFRSSQVTTHVNIGPNTAPETFQFARNWWYCLDNPSQSQPTLPTPEIGGTYGIDPQFVDPASNDFHLRPGSPAQHVGAYAV